MCQDRCHHEVTTLETGQHREPAILHRAPASLPVLGNLHPGKVWAVSTCSWVGLDAGSPVCMAEQDILIIHGSGEEPGTSLQLAQGPTSPEVSHPPSHSITGMLLAPCTKLHLGPAPPHHTAHGIEGWRQERQTTKARLSAGPCCRAAPDGTAWMRALTCQPHSFPSARLVGYWTQPLVPSASHRWVQCRGLAQLQQWGSTWAPSWGCRGPVFTFCNSLGLEEGGRSLLALLSVQGHLQAGLSAGAAGTSSLLC